MRHVSIIDRDRGVGYIQMNSFQKSTVQELDTALASLRQQGLRALVWDLRGNPGGLLTTAVEVLDRFISEGVLVSTRGRVADQNSRYEAHRARTLNIPLVLLIDGDSASASEIVAGALQAAGRAVIIGERTYGKGSVQTLIDMEGATSALKLTTATYFIGKDDKKKNIHRFPDSKESDEWGVKPNPGFEIKLTDEERINYLKYRRLRDIVRQPNQIQFASTANGAPLFQNNPIVGATLIGALGGSGNATTTPGGAIYYASDFHVSRGAFNLNYSGSQWKGHNFPFALFLQGTHNSGAKFDENAYMLGASIGQTARLGDFQLQYQYFYKPANAFISQFSDDDVGTGSGVNVKTNQLRINFGITRFLVWENRLYIQHGISLSNPAINYYVPLQQGYHTQYRLHSQFVFTF